MCYTWIISRYWLLFTEEALEECIQIIDNCESPDKIWFIKEKSLSNSSRENPWIVQVGLVTPCGRWRGNSGSLGTGWKMNSSAITLPAVGKLGFPESHSNRHVVISLTLAIFVILINSFPATQRSQTHSYQQIVVAEDVSVFSYQWLAQQSLWSGVSSPSPFEHTDIQVSATCQWRSLN